MKLENLNPRHVHDAAEAALSDLSRLNGEKRKNLFDRYRYKTVTGFLGRNPRQVKRTDEEIKRSCDIEIACMEHLQDEYETTINLLYCAAQTALNLGARMSLTTEEFLAIRSYLP